MDNDYIEIVPTLNPYGESITAINAIIKESISVIDINTCIEPLIEFARFTSKTLSESINASLIPLIDTLNEVNAEIVASANTIMSNISLDSLNNLKLMSSYSADIIQAIDEVYTSVGSLKSFDIQSGNLDEFKDSLLDLKQDIQESTLTKENFIAFIGLLISILTFFQPYFDNSSDTIIEQQKEIIELQEKQLDSINNLKNILQNDTDISTDVSTSSNDISKSLKSIVESVEY